VPKMFLNGSAMSGQKDHGCITGSTFLGPARTAGKYRFFAVRDEFPGLFPVASQGRMIDGELYDIPENVLRDQLLPSEPQELAFGEIELDDGQIVNAMILQPDRIAKGDKVVDIAEIGGFRSYQAFLSSNTRMPEILGRPDLAGAPQ
jgi:gamma-glutamylcyclotransferase (GGCT)/AIG2-like uncharacterized protein YtfP